MIDLIKTRLRSYYVLVSSCLFLILQCVLHLAEVELLARASLEDVQHVEACCLKVRCRVVGLGDEELTFCSIVHWLESITHLNLKFIVLYVLMIIVIVLKANIS